MNLTDLKDASRIGFNAIAKMERREFVFIKNLPEICVALDCNIRDVIDIETEKD